MRILYFNYSDSNLATMIRCFELARAAAGNGNQVTLCFLNRLFSPPAFFLDLLKEYNSSNLTFEYTCKKPHAIPEKSPGERQTPVPSLGKARKNTAHGLLKRAIKSFRYFPAELALIKKYSPDVVVARPDLVFSFLLSTRISGIPLVLSTDGPVEELEHYWGIKAGWVKIFDTLRLKMSDAVLYVSKVCGQLMIAKGLRQKLFYCPNGADPDFFKPLHPPERLALRKELNLDEALVIGFSGNQVGYHGIGGLIRTCRPLLEKNPAVKLLIVGTIKDPESLNLSEFPEQLIRGQVVFTGMLPYTQMPKHIDCADLMVMPYPDLDFFHFSPMKMFEALAMGKIIVAPELGQIKDVLEGVPSAFLYDPKRDSALGEAIQTALAAVEQGRNGQESRDLLFSAHTWQQRGMVLQDACEFALRRRAGGQNSLA